MLVYFIAQIQPQLWEEKLLECVHPRIKEKENLWNNLLYNIHQEFTKVLRLLFSYMHITLSIFKKKRIHIQFMIALQNIMILIIIQFQNKCLLQLEVETLQYLQIQDLLVKLQLKEEFQHRSVKCQQRHHKYHLFHVYPNLQALQIRVL